MSSTPIPGLVLALGLSRLSGLSGPKLPVTDDRPTRTYASIRRSDRVSQEHERAQGFFFAFVRGSTDAHGVGTSSSLPPPLPLSRTGNGTLGQPTPAG